MQGLPNGHDALVHLTVGGIERLIAFFWDVLNVRYPILHRPSFQMVEASIDVALAIITFAAARSLCANDQHLAGILLPIVRGAVLSVS